MVSVFGLYFLSMVWNVPSGTVEKSDTAPKLTKRSSSYNCVVGNPANCCNDDPVELIVGLRNTPILWTSRKKYRLFEDLSRDN